VPLQVGLAWLNRWAAAIAGKDQAPALCMSIASQLFAAQSSGLGADELAAQLLDLLGDAAFEAVGQLLERRWGSVRVSGCGRTAAWGKDSRRSSSGVRCLYPKISARLPVDVLAST
jgi:hypothetical protein